MGEDITTNTTVKDLQLQDALWRENEIFHSLKTPAGFIVLRMDGKNFTTLTKNHYQHPFDAEFSKTMIVTARSLMKEFNTLAAVTHSDEISVILPASFAQYNRNVEKLVSIAAAIASSSFTVTSGYVSFFDARIALVTQDPQKVIQYLLWRQQDAWRGFVNSTAYWAARSQGHSPRRADKLIAGKTLEKLQYITQTGIVWQDLPNWQRRGTLLYWEQFQKTGTDPRTNISRVTTRRHIVAKQDLGYSEVYANQLEKILEA